MNTIIFTIGFIIFVLFLMSDITEVKNENKSNDKNSGYYERHQPEKEELE